MPNYHNPHPPTALPKVLSPGEVTMLLATTDAARDQYAVRDSAILHTLYSTGCRSAELCSMVLTRCDLPSSRILIQGKYRRERYAFLSPQAHRAVSIWIDHRARFADNHDYLFCNLPSGAPLSDRVLRLVAAGRGAAALGPWVHVHPHMLRHSMATHLTDNGIDMPDLARLLGHASLDSTLVYQHVAPNRLAAIHDRFSEPATREPYA